MINTRFTTVLALATLAAGCELRGYDRLVFVDGRGVEPASDSLLVFTSAGTPGVLRLDLAAETLDTLGGGDLASPVHVQVSGDRWYVSDAERGRFSIVVLSDGGRVVERIPLEGISSTPHQFAALEDGSVVVVGGDDQLLRITGDSVITFALTTAGSRPSLLLGAAGGVVHAVPDRHITLYNAFGSVRWRVEWPWAEGAWVSDLAVDSRGRIHAISGISEESFVVYSIVQSTGEIDRWSVPAPTATYSVSRLGEVAPDSLVTWTNRRR